MTTIDLRPRVSASPFDAIKQTHPSGAERWSARDLMPLMAYSRWEDFEKITRRALASAANVGREGGFSEITEEGTGGRPRANFILDREAAYLVAMNGDPNKPEVASAQAYFVSRTREAELAHADLSTPAGMLAMAEQYAAAARALVDADRKVHALEARAERDAPKVVFADAVATSRTNILVRELAKLLTQAGVRVGGNDLFKWLRRDGFLIRQNAGDYNLPTQKSRTLGLFEIKETPVVHDDGRVTISRTPKVTGKGQTYLVNYYMEKAAAS